MQRSGLSIFLCLLFSSATAFAAADAVPATAFRILHVFQGNDGANPGANLTSDKAGNLYGTAEYGGVSFYGSVFRLSPPGQPGGSWTLTTLYSFRNIGDGARPTDSLLLDGAGSLFGTTSDSDAGGYGEVFELTPPASGAGEWTETVLYSFTGSAEDGAYPQGGLISDAAGNLFGTTQTSVFELSPPTNTGGQWTFTQLHSFACCTADGFNSFAGLVRDKKGNLYGTTEFGGFYGTSYCAYEGCGTVFEVSPPSSPGGSWTERVLYQFKSNIGGYSDGFVPLGGLVLDGKGNLFGNTDEGGALGGGTVFELSPPSTGKGVWTERILHSFAYASTDGAAPIGNLVIDKAGSLYGTTMFGGNRCIYNSTAYGCGTAFKLTPNGGTWNETILALFKSASGAARFPFAGLLMDPAGRLFGTTQYGGNNGCQVGPANGCGTVFELGP